MPNDYLFKNIPEKLWKDFRRSCLESDCSYKDKLIQLIENYLIQERQDVPLEKNITGS